MFTKNYAVVAVAGVLPLLLLSAAFSQQPQPRLIGVPEDVGDGLTYPMDPAKLGLTIPRVVGDTAVDRRLASPRTVFYRLPQVFQQWVPAGKIETRDLALGTVTHSTRAVGWGIYSTKVLPEFNANSDFPWESTFGLNLAHRDKKVPSVYDVLNFLSLPEDEQGQVIPIVVLDERPVKWLFPPGTMFGEIIYVKHAGKAYVQEIRTRSKGSSQTTWHPSIYRPIRDREEFQRLTGLHYAPARKYMTFRNPEEDEVFAISGTVEKLPDLPEATVISLLQRPFQDVTDAGWSPMSEQEFSILPKDYSLGLIKEPTAEACANCHRQTAISVRSLIPREPLIVKNPDKVGNIRGSDGIFTWHPFSKESVAQLPTERNGNIIYLRRFDAENKLVKIVRRGDRLDRSYKLTRYVQSSLAPYDLPLDPAYLHEIPRKCDCEDPTCDCGDKCRCDHPRAWKPYFDDRRLVAAQAPVPLQIRPTGAGLRWVSHQGDLYLRDDQAQRWVGYYSTKDRFYRRVVREEGNDLVFGTVEPPPIPLPEVVK